MNNFNKNIFLTAVILILLGSLISCNNAYTYNNGKHFTNKLVSESFYLKHLENNN